MSDVKHCPQCDDQMESVIKASEGFKFQGWYCIRCRLFEKFTGKKSPDESGQGLGVVLRNCN